MSSTWSRIVVVCAVLPGAAVMGQIHFLDFGTTTNLMLAGNAQQSGNVLRVCSSVISDRGAAWYAFPLPVAQGFDTAFTFRITSQVAGGGDGMTFCVQNDPRLTAALGNHAGQIGYGAFAGSPAGTAIANSLVVEIDTYGNGNQSDPDGNHISVHTNGPGDNGADEALSIGRVSPATNMSDGQVHALRVRYVPGTLDVFLDDLANPALTISYDIVAGGTHVNSGTPVPGLNLLPGASALVGFTAGNGAAYENHDVLGWLTPPYEFQLNSPASTLTLNGMADPGPFQAIALTSALNQTAMFSLTTTSAGLPFEVIVAAPGVPLGYSALLIATPGLQALNIDPAGPGVFFLNGGAAPSLAVPFVGTSFALYLSSSVPLQAGAQMLNLDPTHPDSFRLSHAGGWTVQ